MKTREDLFGMVYILLAVYFPSEIKFHDKVPIGSQINLSVGVGSILAICIRRGREVTQLGKTLSLWRISPQDIYFFLCNMRNVFLHRRSTRES